MKARLVTSVALLAVSGQSVAEPVDPAITISVAPGHIDRAHNTTDVDVVIEVPQTEAAAGEPLFDFPLGAELHVTDDRGAVPVSRPAQTGEDRPYVAARAVHGTLRIGYRVPIGNTPLTAARRPSFPGSTATASPRSA